MQLAVAKDSKGNVVIVLKFFATQQEYENEATLYSRSPDVLECMPNVIDKVSNKYGRFKDRIGNRMPPYIAMEKGVCLTTIMKSPRNVENT